MLNFMGIGAQKCGTTWLYQALNIHPKIQFPGGKEIHFWDGHLQLQLQDYLNIFLPNEFINGDITPAYGFIDKIVIQKIYKLYPELKLVYIIRNPIERAWSQARMALNRDESQQFANSDEWIINHFNSQASLLRGDYETCIKNWRGVFPVEQLKIFYFEDIIYKPIILANDCLNHIGLDDFFTDEHLPLLAEKIFPGRIIELREPLVRHLYDLYKNKIMSLSNYLEVDLQHWLDPYK